MWGERRNRADKVASWPANTPASTPTRRSKERAAANFRDSDGKQSCKRGFLSPQAAAIDKAGLHVQAAAGTLHLSTARFEDYFESWLAGHKPFIDPAPGATTAPMASSA